MVPYLVYLFFFSFYSTYVNPQKGESDQLRNLDFILKLLLAAISCYLLNNEITQFKDNGKEYFYSAWNYLDFTPPLLLILLIIINFFTADAAFQYPLLAFVALCMWLKFLYFFRVFKSTGYLIFMLSRVLVDMVPFFTVLVIGFVAFASAFLIIAMTNENEQQFVDTFPKALVFVYMVALGDWDTGNFGESYLLLVWSLFLVATVFNLIIMFNLLIAIISETFAKINENSSAFTQQVMASVIAENGYLIPKEEKKLHCESGKYLLFVTYIKEQNNEQDQIELINEIKDMLFSQVSALSSLQEADTKKQKMLDKIYTQVLKVKLQTEDKVNNYVFDCL